MPPLFREGLEKEKKRIMFSSLTHFVIGNYSLFTFSSLSLLTHSAHRRKVLSLEPETK